MSFLYNMIGYRSRTFPRIPTGGNKDSSKGGIRASTKKKIWMDFVAKICMIFVLIKLDYIKILFVII
jgi:hypothetical protein